MSQHATCDHCARLHRVTSAGLIARHYLSIDVTRRAIHAVGRGRVKRLWSGSGRPPRKVER
jgi:hypothetical protein